MPEQLKINIPEEVCLTTIRTQNSRLWFVNNKKVENEVLSYLAKYQNIYGAVIYAFILMGNHYHMVVKFPRGNRHKFKKVFNRIFANILKRHEKEYLGGNVWGRRYRPQGLPRPTDIKHWFFYTALNPISSGLVTSICEYPIFNSFFMSLSGESRTFQFFDREKYQNLKRYNKKITKADCTEEYKLTFSKLPGCEDMSQEEYKNFLAAEYKKRRRDILKRRKEAKQGFMGKAKLLQQVSGSYPMKTKASSRNSHRPLYLSLCPETLALCLKGYFSVLDAYIKASHRYRQGFINTKFPAGTFRPPAIFDTAHSVI